MVDFGKLLREEYPNYTSLTCPQTEKVLGVRTHAVTGEVTGVECEVFIKDGWIYLIGGPTGYESFELTESNTSLLSEGWNACNGTKNRWDSLFIHGNSLIEAIRKLQCTK